MTSQEAKTIEGLKADLARLREILSITEDNLRASQNEVLRLSTIDPLTSVLSRRHFMDIADQEISRARRYKRPLAVLAIELDNIKAINEVHGTELGDAVLIAVGAAVLRSLRATDFVGRTAGSEFTVMLPETEHEGCMSLAERLVIDLARAAAAEVGNTEPLPTVSIGATHFVREDVIFDTVVQRVDQAMERAHAAGGNRTLYLGANQIEAEF
ncbi:GGDEF domain-containing protein [Rhodospirillum rubrum]|uniref:GGDEF domain-containing protein n=1 Tax=Rhodospirillum rubrum TaxID=1085 RepID=UPI001905BDE9|nr:GGDEF domain-containing protein [Rhodospirillum rubrum]MBK1663334.1 GGDEF domain-containing protein [Rhodospirillum rubrum]MBK1675145.1 GGDEF domain-containing protein [Rhodospirillum rubrum]